MALTLIKCVLHHIAMYVLFPHLILRPLVAQMDASKVNWHEGRTAILPGVYQDICKYRFQPSAAVTTDDISDTLRADCDSTIQADGGWQHRLKIGHNYNFLCNKILICTPLLVLSLRKFQFILKVYQIVSNSNVIF